MKPKTALVKIAPLLKAFSFSTGEAKQLGVSSALLSHYVKTGELIRLGRGVYRGAEAPTGGDFRWEDLADAVARTRGGVICMVSALALYDLTEEIPRQYWIAISNNTRHRADASVRVVRLRNMELGKTNLKLDGLILPIFDRERTIVDAFRYLSKETAIKALRVALTKKGKEKIDLIKIRDYAKILRVNIEAYLLGMTV